MLTCDVGLRAPQLTDNQSYTAQSIVGHKVPKVALPH